MVRITLNTPGIELPILVHMQRDVQNVWVFVERFLDTVPYNTSASLIVPCSRAVQCYITMMDIPTHVSQNECRRGRPTNQESESSDTFPPVASGTRAPQ